MNTLIDQPVSAFCRHGLISVRLYSGKEFTFPVEGNSRLEGKSEAQLNRIELSPFGLHWPDLDEDLSIRGIAEGRYGQIVVKDVAPVRTHSPSVDQLKKAVTIGEQIQRLEAELHQILGGGGPMRPPPPKRKYTRRALPKSSAKSISFVKAECVIPRKRRARALAK